MHITCERYQTNPKKKRDARVIGIPFRSQVIRAISLTLCCCCLHYGAVVFSIDIGPARSKTTPLIIHPNSTPPNVISLTLKHCSNQCRGRCASKTFSAFDGWSPNKVATFVSPRDFIKARPAQSASAIVCGRKRLIPS